MTNSFSSLKRFTLIYLFCLHTLTLIAKEIKVNSLQYKTVKTAIQSASPGDVILLPSGTVYWNASDKIKVNGGIKIIGDGKERTIFKRSEPSSLAFFEFSGTMLTKIILS